MAALNRAWSLRCQVRSAGAGSVIEGLALAVIVRGGVSFPGGRYVAPIASATRRASPEFSEPGARRTPRNRHLRTLPGKGRPGAPVYRAAACRTRSFSLLTRHDDTSLCIVRFRERRGSQGCSCTPGWPGRAAGGHQPPPGGDQLRDSPGRLCRGPPPHRGRRRGRAAGVRPRHGGRPGHGGRRGAERSGRNGGNAGRDAGGPAAAACDRGAFSIPGDP